MITFILLLSLFSAALNKQMITKKFIEQLKKTAPYEVEDYEENIFKGWTKEDGAFLADLPADLPSEESALFASVESSGEPLPEKLDWREKSKDCILAVGNQRIGQNSCGCSYAFGTTHMLSERNCILTGQSTVLSIQEIVSCSTENSACSGGWPVWVIKYANENNGIVTVDCMSYAAGKTKCQKQCENSENWADAHKCNCYHPKQCIGVEGMKRCLQTGPITASYDVCDSIYNYRNGTYECECREILGRRVSDIVGYGVDENKKGYWIVKQSWGTGFGKLGGYIYIKMDSCKIDRDIKSNLMCDEVL